MAKEERICPGCGKAVVGPKNKVFCKRACMKKTGQRRRSAARSLRLKNRYRSDTDYRAKVTGFGRAYRIANKDEINARRRKNQSYKKKNQIRKNRDSEELRDGYIKLVLCNKNNLTAKDIPQSLIDAKRSHLKCLRLIKEQLNG